jgi:glycosyltransferase involved in cell wall biosynthesis
MPAVSCHEREHTSVIIPVRNGARFIAEAVGSALRQVASHDEVVVVDDNSTDATRLVLARMQDRRVRVLDGSGRGVSSARNIGLAAATGEFIAFLDHDDLWPPKRHAALLQVLLADAAVDCAIGRLRLRMEHDAVLLPQLADMEGRLALNLSLCTALFRRRILDLVGAFDEEMQFCEDTDYLLRLAEHNYRAVLCDIDALIYRRHGTNATYDESGRRNGFLQLIKRRRIRISARAEPGH